MVTCRDPVEFQCMENTDTYFKISSIVFYRRYKIHSPSQYIFINLKAAKIAYMMTFFFLKYQKSSSSACGGIKLNMVHAECCT